MRLNLSTPREAPRPPFECELVELDTRAIPFVLGALWQREQRYYWMTEEDAKLGRQMLAKQGAQMLMGCTDRIVEAVDRLYRLTDTIHNGALYIASGTGTPDDPIVFNPPIPIVPHRLPGEEPSIKFSLEKTLRLVDNLTNATTYSDAPDDRNIRQQLDDIKAALERGENLDPEMLAQLVQIASLLA